MDSATVAEFGRVCLCLWVGGRNDEGGMYSEGQVGMREWFDEYMHMHNKKSFMHHGPVS